ncbi:hypothetical protein HY636_05970 [Candidatus Woesearchaeota archaeon]|nr:hypothetical protein [Candidatus Woesearchaeota archaeon]
MTDDNINEEENNTKTWLEGDMLKVEYYGDVYNFDLTKVDEREIERGKFSVVLFDETDSFCVKISSGNSRGVTRNDIYVHKHLEKIGLLSRLDSPFIAQLRLENENSLKKRTDIYFMKNMKRFGAVTLDDVIDFEKVKREKEEEEGEDINGCEVTTKTLKLSHALSFYRKLLSQLNVLHKEGVIHFDIAPGNVFLKYSTKIEDAGGKKRRIRQLSEIILIDYGLARKKEMAIGLFFNQKRAFGTPSAGSYKTCYKGHSDREIAWYNEDVSPLELMLGDSSTRLAAPSMDIYQATNLVVWALTGNSAFYLKGNHLVYMINILKASSKDKEAEELYKERFDREKRKMEEKIKERGNQLLNIYRELFVKEYDGSKVEKIEDEVKSGEYTTLLECVESQYGKMLRRIIEKNNKETLDGSDGQFLDALIPILVRGTGSLNDNYKSVEDLLASDNSSGELDKLEKKYPHYFNYESAEDIVDEERKKGTLPEKAGGVSFYSGLKKIAEKLGISHKKTSEPTAPQPTPSHAVPSPPPKQQVSTSPAPQQPTASGEEESLTIDDAEDKAVQKLEKIVLPSIVEPTQSTDKAVQSLEAKLEKKSKTPKIPLRINLLAQEIKEKYVSWYQKHKKKVIIGGIAAAVLGVGGLSYYLYNKYDLCCPRSLNLICGKDTCSEPEPAPTPPPTPVPKPVNIPKPISTPRIAELDMIANPRLGPEEVVCYWWWCKPSYRTLIKTPEQPTESQQPQTNDLGEIKLKTYPRRHVSDPIEIDLVKEGIDGIKTKDDLAKEFNPEKGIGELKADDNKIKPIYDSNTGKIRVKPREKDGKPYIGQAQLSIKTKDGDCSTYCFEFKNEKPEALKKGTLVEILEHGRREIDLRDYFKDDGDKDSLTFSDISIDAITPGMKGKIEVKQITEKGSKITLRATEPDFFSQTKDNKYTLDSVVKVKFTASDENYKVENWAWIAVTPVNDCPRVKKGTDIGKVRYVPKDSKIFIPLTDIFSDPEGDYIKAIVRPEDNKDNGVEVTRVLRKDDKDGKTTIKYEIKYAAAPLKREVNVVLLAHDNETNDKCQREDGAMASYGIAVVPVIFHSWEPIPVGGYDIFYRILDTNLSGSTDPEICNAYTSNLSLTKEGKKELEENIISYVEEHNSSLDNISGRISYDKNGVLLSIEGFGYLKQGEKDKENPSSDSIRSLFKSDFRPEIPYKQDGLLCVQVRFEKIVKKEIK